MKQRPRIYYTESQKAVMWERWRKGESLQQITSCLIETTHQYKAFWRRRVGYVRRHVAVRGWR